MTGPSGPPGDGTSRMCVSVPVTGSFWRAAGCGIVTAAAKRIKDAGQPRRTIRILWAGAEEPGERQLGEAVAAGLRVTGCPAQPRLPPHPGS